MKKRVLISASIICLALLGLFVVLPGHRASASIISSQTTDTQDFSGGHLDYVCEGVIPLSDYQTGSTTITSWTLRGHCDTPGQTISSYLYHTPRYATYWGEGSGYSQATTTCSGGTTPQNYTFYAIPGFEYNLQTLYASYPDEWIAVSVNSDILPRVKTPKDNYGISKIPNEYDESFYYILEGSVPNSVSFTWPENATSTLDFLNWIYNFEFSEEHAQKSIRVSYSQDLSECETWNDGLGCYIDAEGLYSLTEGNEFLAKAWPLAVGTWEAEADLGYWELADFNIVASSSISFTITGAWAGGETYPTKTWATSTLPIQLTCDPNDNFFEYSLCKLGKYLFEPRTNLFSQFVDLGEMIKHKAPIGYFYLIQTSFNSLSTSTEAVSLGDLGPISTYIFDPFKIGITFLLWIMFVVWAFNRIRHLQI